MGREIQPWCDCKLMRVGEHKRGEGCTSAFFVPLPHGYLDVESRVLFAKNKTSRVLAFRSDSTRPNIAAVLAIDSDRSRHIPPTKFRRDGANRVQFASKRVIRDRRRNNDIEPRRDPSLQRTLTWFCRKYCACVGSCPAAAGLACWNIAICRCCVSCCCCCSVEASAWISCGARAARDPCISNCWLTSWAAKAVVELLLFGWVDECCVCVCCCCWWLPASWLLTPELGEDALPLVPLLLFRCEPSVTWKKKNSMLFRVISVLSHFICWMWLDQLKHDDCKYQHFEIFAITTKSLTNLQFRREISKFISIEIINHLYSY